MARHGKSRGASGLTADGSSYRLPRRHGDEPVRAGYLPEEELAWTEDVEDLDEDEATRAWWIGDCRGCCVGTPVESLEHPSEAALVALDCVRYASPEALAEAQAALHADESRLVVFRSEHPSGLTAHGDPLAVEGDGLAQMLLGLAAFWGLGAEEVRTFSDVPISATAVWKCHRAGLTAADAKALRGQMSPGEFGPALDLLLAFGVRAGDMWDPEG